MDEGHSGGGSLSLAEYLDEYGAGVYADFHFYYGLDLGEMLRSGVPSPRIRALIARLPTGSMTRAMEIDADHWDAHFEAGHTYYQLAGIYDAVNTNTASTGFYKKRPKFEPWPIPSRKKEKRVTVAGLYKSLGGGSGAVTEDGLIPVVPD